LRGKYRDGETLVQFKEKRQAYYGIPKPISPVYQYRLYFPKVNLSFPS